MIDVKNISFQYGKESFMKDLSVSFKKGKITTIIGPNGSGKSTLLMLIARILKPQSGDIFLEEKNIHTFSLKNYAQHIAVVHQKNTLEYSTSVETIVGYGRLPYMHYHQQLSQEDYDIIDWAIQVTGLDELRKKEFHQLSGGQQQRVWIAMALAQKTPILLLDEPTTYLDIKYQLEILELIKKINKELNITIIMVHHDMNQAIHYSDDIVAMKKGHIQFMGHSQEVVTQESLTQLYDCPFEMIEYHGRKIVMSQTQ